jgi:hypothetical protein
MEFPNRNVPLEHTLKSEPPRVLVVKPASGVSAVVGSNAKVVLGPLLKHRAAPSVELAVRVPPLKRHYVLMAATL